MTADQAISVLRRHEAALKGLGVRHAALFGSVARGEASPASDIDIMLDVEPDAPIGVFEYVGIVQYVEGLFAGRVDVSNRQAQREAVRRAAERDLIYAF